MLIKMLPKPEKGLLLDLLQLLALSDNPILWDGKRYDELTSDTDLSKLSIQVDELERELISDLERSSGQSLRGSSSFEGVLAGVLAGGLKSGKAPTSIVEEQLIAELKTFPIHKMELPETRVAAAKAVLDKLLEDQSKDRPEPPKIMLFDMILLALRDGSISSIERELLKAFQHHYQIQDFIFEELLDRAEALNSEVSKTIALVLE
ncbi:MULTISPECIES: hypothetical protein [Pseudomonadaceae]|jgi:hypothetical protein|uniref:hypothetical protein n=1 Tax=Pseudomonadaceae TaxID=135621 RepID=UPI0003BB3721|nr:MULTISPECIES: hypothetical protein [Pseudomonadaceae]EJY6040374.1 hypothetical protein [Pseudomonas aeruginosa]EKN9357356.1 hypothetical protein [Pseudomonas aeruginosa]EKW2827231.1 hypothetical protein [Pseudomonas aeruginosa]ELQ8277491.1 hypothetical protein [Pseudomonas aeruginosa]ERZ25644.1 hypothetical protein Q007_00314 [Pseudomonas aeruginosa S54485]